MSTAGLSASLMLDFNVLEISPGPTQAEPNAVLENIYQIFFAIEIKIPLMPRVVYSSSPIITPIFPKVTIEQLVYMLVPYGWNFSRQKTEAQNSL